MCWTEGHLGCGVRSIDCEREWARVGGYADIGVVDAGARPIRSLSEIRGNWLQCTLTRRRWRAASFGELANATCWHGVPLRLRRFAAPFRQAPYWSAESGLGVVIVLQSLGGRNASAELGGGSEREAT